MGSIYLDEYSSIRKFSSSGTGTKTIVKVEIEVAEPYALAGLLRDLAAAQQKDAEKLSALKEAKRQGQRIQKRISAPRGRPLLLTFQGDD